LNFPQLLDTHTPLLCSMIFGMWISGESRLDRPLRAADQLQHLLCSFYLYP
jgi:hypothetical protein